jgi:hypothetical protein
LIAAIILPLLLFVANCFRSIADWLGRAVLVLPLLLIVGIVGSRYAARIGRENPRRDLYVSTTTLPYVTFESATDALQVGCSLDEVNYRLLAQSNGQIFAILPIDAEPGHRYGGSSDL